MSKAKCIYWNVCPDFDDKCFVDNLDGHNFVFTDEIDCPHPVFSHKSIIAKDEIFNENK
jgi:hypothetical protein